MDWGQKVFPACPPPGFLKSSPRGRIVNGATSKQVGLLFREFGILVSIHSFMHFSRVPVPKIPLVSSPVSPPYLVSTHEVTAVPP